MIFLGPSKPKLFFLIFLGIKYCQTDISWLVRGYSIAIPTAPERRALCWLNKQNLPDTSVLHIQIFVHRHTRISIDPITCSQHARTLVIAKWFCLGQTRSGFAAGCTPILTNGAVDLIQSPIHGIADLDMPSSWTRYSSRSVFAKFCCQGRRWVPRMKTDVDGLPVNLRNLHSSRLTASKELLGPGGSSSNRWYGVVPFFRVPFSSEVPDIWVSF